MSILARAYGPAFADQQQLSTLMSGMGQAQLPDRPPLPQVRVQPPQFMAPQPGGGGSGAGIGQVLGALGAIAGAYFTGGASLAALPGILGAGAAGSALGGTVGGAIDS
ncbi:MAG: hypothetical protein ACRDIC_19680 [bacterium]